MSFFEIITATAIFGTISIAIFLSISANSTNVHKMSEREKIVHYYNTTSDKLATYIKNKTLSESFDIVAVNSDIDLELDSYTEEKEYVHEVDLIKDDLTDDSYFLKFIMFSKKANIKAKFIKTLPKGEIIDA